MKRLKNSIMWILLIICLMPELSWAEEIKLTAYANDISDHCAQLQWETNIETTGQMMYHPVREFQNNLAISIGLATTHSISLSKLLAGTMYQYQIRVRDADGHTAASEWAAFTTTGV
ncbi:MAG: fibronectin type III domain-containing protein, partial [Candidatus Desantisbacteria bacterium]